MLYFNSRKKEGKNMSKLVEKIDKILSNLSNRTIVIIAFIAIISGVLIISADYLEGKKERAYQKISISLYNESPKKIEQPEEPE